MPDGYGPDFLTRSMFFREAEAGPSQQELATMTAPFGGSPEQAMAFLQSPGAQQMLQHFGLGGFNPTQIRQSPFLPNQFMQGHPRLGGFLNQGLASMAATPEAPLVSGVGSGLSRFAQGAYGGPELLRQYQVRQLMAPFQAMGMQMPAMAEFRRQQLLKALVEDMQRKPAEFEELQKEREQARLTQRAERTAPRISEVPGGGGAWISQFQDPRPAVPPQQMQAGGPGAAAIPGAPQQPGPSIGGLGGLVSPGYPSGAPATQGGWGEPQFHATDPDLIRRQAEAKLAGRPQKPSKTYDQKAIEGFGEKKETIIQQLEREFAPNFRLKDPSGRMDDKSWQAQSKAKAVELEGRKQQVYDWYDQMVQGAGGQTVPGRVGGGKLPPQVSPGAAGPPPPRQDINQHPDMQGQAPGWYRDSQTGQEFYWDGKAVGQPPQQ